MTLADAILSVLLTLSPPEKLPQYPGFEETVAEATDRYASFARDVEVVVVEGCAGRPNEQECQRRSTALLVGIARHETDFARDTDYDGPCFHGVWRGWDYRRRCDGGRSVSAWQLQSGTVAERRAWRADRKEAARAALRFARQSMGVCRRHGNEGALAAYADGNCDSVMGLVRARELWGWAWRVHQVLAPWA